MSVTLHGFIFSALSPFVWIGVVLVRFIDYATRNNTLQFCNTVRPLRRNQ